MAKKALGKNINVDLGTVSPIKHTWSGSTCNDVRIYPVSCRGDMTEKPNDLVINRISDYYVEIDASEPFVVNFRINNHWVASLPSNEVIKRSWEINKDLTALPG